MGFSTLTYGAAVNAAKNYTDVGDSNLQTYIDTRLLTVGSVAIVTEVFTATALQTLFTLSTETYDTAQPAFVFEGGSIQTAPTNFAKTSSSSFTMSEGVAEGTTVVFVGFNMTEGTGASTWFNDAGVPNDSNGNNGDYYLNTTTYDIYTKTSGSWGSPIGNLKGTTGDTGATGSAGADGADGVGVPAGGTTGQILSKTSNDNYATTWVTPSSGLYSNAVASATVSTMTETIVSDVDTSTDTFTSVGHSLSDNDRIYFTLNTDAGAIYLPDKIPGGCVAGTKYYVVNKTTDAFQISTSLGGAAVDLTTNANLDLTKWHFESQSGDGKTLTVSGLTAKRRYRCIVKGKTLGNPLMLINPNGWDTSQSSFLPSTSTTAFSSSLPIGTGDGTVTFYTEAFFDAKYSNYGYVSFEGIQVKHNNATANSSVVRNSKSFSPVYGGADITSITLSTNSNGDLANGTTIEVYEA
jgi:hypothetical protein